jgi:hypothetical protein
MTIPAVLFVDNFGRRPLLMWGEANMAISHAVLAAVIAVYGGRFDTNKAAGNVSGLLIWLIDAARTDITRVLSLWSTGTSRSEPLPLYDLVATLTSDSFAVTWGPLAWVVSAEVFPLDMRAKGMGISSAIK